MDNLQQERASLRKQLRQARRAQSRKVQSLNARKLARQLILSRHFRQSKHIAFYLAEDGEISTRYAIQLAWRFGKTVYLPVLSPYADSLFFAPYTPRTRMKKNRFRINEPDCPVRRCKRAHQLQIIYMPLVGFDTQGNRLGMGGGFYDRTLHFRNHQQRWKKPRIVGLAHECQRSREIPAAAWDIPLDAIITEARQYRPTTSTFNS